MGWFDDRAPGHEGHSVAYVVSEGCAPDSQLYRELVYPSDNASRRDVQRLGAGCSCGWRSPYVYPSALDRPEWHPFSPDVSERDGDVLRSLWLEHVRLGGCAR